MNKKRSDSSARTLARKAYHQIRHDIVSGQLEAGSKLRLESLVQRYDIGMSPIREALARLVGDQLVKTEDQRGFWVAPLSLEELDDVSRVRMLVETEALRLSIANADEEWEQAVRAAFQDLAEIETGLLVNRQSLPQETMDLWEDRNRKFHSALVANCNSPWLVRLQELLYHQAERYRRVSLSQAPGRRFLHDEHVAIFEAGLERNALRACRLTEEHLMRTYDEVRNALERLQTTDEEDAA